MHLIVAQLTFFREQNRASKGTRAFKSEHANKDVIFMHVYVYTHTCNQKNK